MELGVGCRCGDVTELQLPPNSADLVFSNWLLMYLSDEEVSALAVNMLQWVSGCVYLAGNLRILPVVLVVLTLKLDHH